MLKNINPVKIQLQQSKISSDTNYCFKKPQVKSPSLVQGVKQKLLHEVFFI